MTKKQASLEWDKYVRRKVLEPYFAKCLIQWHNDESMSIVFIALRSYDKERDGEYDDDVFFYAEGKEDFLRLFNEEGEDFTIREVYYFTNTLDQ